MAGDGKEKEREGNKKIDAKEESGERKSGKIKNQSK